MAVIPELLASGTVLGGRYRIVGLVGSGGSSHVYAAADLKLPGKKWAVKQIAPREEFDGEAGEEAAMLIALEHPRLPRIVDFFPAEQGEGGCRFLVMDFIEGITLEAFMQKKGFFSAELLIRIAEQICEGLQYLHTREPPIIYRDLKPSNMMIEESGEIRFIDFGTARSYKPQHTDDTVKLGTVGFAAPEQYAGTQSDARTDLYALGAIMLYLASAGKYTDWLQAGSNPQFRKDLPPELLRIIRKLLSYEQADRYSSAIELMKELRQLRAPVQLRAGLNEASNRTTVIAVAGAAPGLGSTHLSLLLAHSLSSRFPKVAVLEWNEKSRAFLSVRQALEAKERSGNELFKIGKVAYCRKPSRMELLQLLNGGNGLVVMDMGSDIDKEGYEEFARADLQLIVVSAAPWRRKELEDSQRLLSSIGRRNRAYVVPFAEESVTRQLSRHLKGSRCWTIPAENNLFDPGENTVHAVERVCEVILPKRQASISGRFKELFWKNKV